MEITAEEREIKGSESEEPCEEAREVRECWVADCERESKTVSDGKELLAN